MYFLEHITYRDGDKNTVIQLENYIEGLKELFSLALGKYAEELDADSAIAKKLKALLDNDQPLSKFYEDDQVQRDISQLAGTQSLWKKVIVFFSEHSLTPFHVMTKIRTLKVFKMLQEVKVDEDINLRFRSVNEDGAAIEWDEDEAKMPVLYDHLCKLQLSELSAMELGEAVHKLLFFPRKKTTQTSLPTPKLVKESLRKENVGPLKLLWSTIECIPHDTRSKYVHVALSWFSCHFKVTDYVSNNSKESLAKMDFFNMSAHGMFEVIKKTF